MNAVNAVNAVKITRPTGWGGSPAAGATVPLAVAMAVAVALTMAPPSPARAASTALQPEPAGGVMVVHGTSEVEREYRAGQAATHDDKEARAHYQRGIDVARSKLRATPDAPDALLWLAANLAGEALTHGKLFALRVIPEIESTLLRLEQVHPTYDHAAAARSLANLYWKAPALISVGSAKKASRYFDVALARSPEFPGNQAMAAAYYSGAGECARARALASAVLRRTDLEGSFGPDAADWRRLARDVLEDCD